jgi:hypothetical protein
MSQTELGRLAFNALMNEVKRSKPGKGKTDYFLDTSLVLRHSTGLAPVQSKKLKTSKFRHAKSSG